MANEQFVDKLDYNDILDKNAKLVIEFFPNFAMMSEELNMIAPPLNVSETMVANIIRFNGDTFNLSKIRREANNEVESNMVAPSVRQIKLFEHSHSTFVDRIDLAEVGNVMDALVRSALANSSYAVHFSRMYQISEILNDASLFTIGENSFDPAVTWSTPATATPQADFLELVKLWDDRSEISRDDPRFVVVASQDVVDLIEGTDEYKAFKQGWINPVFFEQLTRWQKMATYFNVSKFMILNTKVREKGKIKKFFSDMFFLCSVDMPATAYTISDPYTNSSTFVNATRIFEGPLFDFVIERDKIPLNIGGTYAMAYADPTSTGKKYTVLSLSSIALNRDENLVRMESFT